MNQSIIKIPKMTERQKFAFRALGMQNGGREQAKNYLLTLAGFKTSIRLRPRQAEMSLMDKLGLYTCETENSINLKINNRQKNHFLNELRHKTRNVFNNFSFHKPSNKETDWLGIEIECLIDKDKVDYIEESECPDCEGSGQTNYECDSCGSEHEQECSTCGGSGRIGGNEEGAFQDLSDKLSQYKIPYLSIKDDGSLRPSSSQFGVEFTLLVRASDLSPLEKLCQALDDLEAVVNSSCGLHVHVDCRHMTTVRALNVASKFSRAFDLLTGLVPKTRRSNTYCSKKINSIDSGDRYAAINLAAFKKHKTIEIRLHSGSTNFQKISHWALLLQKIKETEFKGSISTVQNAADKLQLAESFIEYLGQRWAQFNGENSNIIPEINELDQNEVA